MSKTITRLFDNFSDAEHAVVELKRSGVPDSDISLVSHEASRNVAVVKAREPHDHTADGATAIDAGAGAAAGGVVGAAGGVLAGLGILAIPGLGPVVAAGWLASAAVGALVGGAVAGAAGGIIGALTNSGVSKEEAEIYAEGVRRGGALVSAKVDASHYSRAEAALNAIPFVDIPARGADYRETGWAGFEENAPPYAEDEVITERTRSTAR